jgi:SAM-dependent methyltransferase
MKKTLLHVGPNHCRIEHTTAGFNNGQYKEVRFDIDPSVMPDILGTMTDMSNVSSESMDAIYSSHNIEHLYPHEVSVAIREFSRVLRPDGVAVVTCPDLQSVAQAIANGNLDQPVYTSPGGPICPIDIVFGHRASMQRGNLYMAHRTGFTAMTLLSAFIQNGFARATAIRDVASYALWIVATKNPVEESTLSALARLHFPRHIELV